MLRYVDLEPAREQTFGLPPELGREALDELCKIRWGSGLKHVSFLHISSWKASGAFRVFLETESSRRWSLIYKNSKYDFHEIPALRNFPVTPGFPEYSIYRDSSGALSNYLPEVYSCIEKIPGAHYQFLLEDLGENFVSAARLFNRTRSSVVVAAFRSFHEAMRDWYVQAEEGGLLRYDREFSLSLINYAKPTFDLLRDSTDSRLAAEVCDIWSQVSSTYLQSEFFDGFQPVPIHGDSNVANVLVHRKRPGEIKLIDWEWAGLGHPFSDLVSMFTGATAATSRKILNGYLGSGKHLDGSQGFRQYEWCRLNRGLINASFMTAQRIGLSTGPEVSAPHWLPFVERFLAVVLEAEAAIRQHSSS